MTHDYPGSGGYQYTASPSRSLPHRNSKTYLSIEDDDHDDDGDHDYRCYISTMNESNFGSSTYDGCDRCTDYDYRHETQTFSEQIEKQSNYNDNNDHHNHCRRHHHQHHHHRPDNDDERQNDYHSNHHTTVTTSKPLESSCSILLQVLFPLLIAGVGMVFAGMLLDHTQGTVVFRAVSEIFILVPALLGLKGNLEMTMASRLSSIANMGLLKSRFQRTETFKANIALTQCQSIGVGFSAALFAAIITAAQTGSIQLANIALLASISIATACLASLVLGFIMMLIIVWSLDYGVNPDNIATPIAAALGDLITLYILYFVSDLFYTISDYFPLICYLVIIGSFFAFPALWRLSARNRHTQIALREGWYPVLAAMFISSIGGLVLNSAVVRFRGLAVFQPLINGVGGNLAAIQASRMSTFLHMLSGDERDDTTTTTTTTIKANPKSKIKPIRADCNPIAFLSRHDIHSRTARLLLALVIPSQLIFLGTIHLLHDSDVPISGPFILAYLACSLAQVFVLLYAAEQLIAYMWSRAIDPDNSSIPYLTAVGDLLGTTFLFIAFCAIAHFDLAPIG